jgi:hypothetical protein
MVVVFYGSYGAELGFLEVNPTNRRLNRNECVVGKLFTPLVTICCVMEHKIRP